MVLLGCWCFKESAKTLDFVSNSQIIRIRVSNTPTFKIGVITSAIHFGCFFKPASINSDLSWMNKLAVLALVFVRQEKDN